MKIVTVILGALLGTVMSFPHNQGHQYSPKPVLVPDNYDPSHKQDTQGHQMQTCKLGETYYFWCDENTKQATYPKTCVKEPNSGIYSIVGDKSSCPQSGDPAPKPDYQPPQQQYPPHQPGPKPDYHPPQQQYPPRKPGPKPGYEPSYHQYDPYQEPPHYYEEPHQGQPGNSYPPQQYPNYYPQHEGHGPYQNQGGQYPHGPKPHGKKPNGMNAVLQLYLIQKFLKKDGAGDADDDKFKDMLKYLLMLQRPGMQGGNKNQLLSLLYGLPGLDGNSGDLSGIFQSLIGHPFGDTSMMPGLSGDGNPLSALMMMMGGGDNTLKDMMSFGNLFPSMGDDMKDLFGGLPMGMMGMPGMGLPQMGDDMKDLFGGLPMGMMGMPGMGLPSMGDDMKDLFGGLPMGMMGMPGMGFPPMGGDSGFPGMNKSPLMSLILSMGKGG